MANFSKLIEKKADAAQYMVDEITHICKDMPKRTPGEEGERIACEYMADVLKKDCGCERSDVESFKENPGSFFGWIYITITCVLAGLSANSSQSPVLSSTADTSGYSNSDFSSDANTVTSFFCV